MDILDDMGVSKNYSFNNNNLCSFKEKFLLITRQKLDMWN